ncbi:hypothetical protein FACS189442_0760 [Spirochaetia bacterium]|nr:hypothetical protein FACS189442_0760 [Spirochaetia bacterium]
MPKDELHIGAEPPLPVDAGHDHLPRQKPVIQGSGNRGGPFSQGRLLTKTGNKNKGQ